MTELQSAYRELRDDGIGHGGAIRALSRRYGIDYESVAQSLKRADAEDVHRRRGARRVPPRCDACGAVRDARTIARTELRAGVAPWVDVLCGSCRSRFSNRDQYPTKVAA